MCQKADILISNRNLTTDQSGKKKQIIFSNPTDNRMCSNFSRTQCRLLQDCDTVTSCKVFNVIVLLS